MKIDQQMSTAESLSTLSSELNQLINKFSQGIKNENKFQRKNTLDSMKKQLSGESSSSSFSNKEFIRFILKNSVNVWNDQMEKCRELSVDIVQLILTNSSKFDYWDSDMTSLILMGLNNRLGGNEVKETCEEVRLQLYKLTHELIESKSTAERTTFEVHFQELISILINAINDNYAEVKKTGCSCTRLLASKLTGSVFHMQSESLVKPLLVNMTHQHSRVRKDIVECLADVVLHGNNKSVPEIVPHLAQRLFDQAHTVRQAIIKLVGTWLLDLPDRYSFFHRLIPLLLTGYTDESVEIKELTEALWWDIGIKYHKENEEELKDKFNFLNEDHPNYPPEFHDKRPNIGSRELVKQNASKILPGILNDVGDWVEATRIKSIQLLYIMIWQSENNITQNLETVLQTLFKASTEKIQAMQTSVVDCSRLVGHFTDPSLSLKLAFKSIKRMSPPNNGSISILNGLLVGHSPALIPFDLILDTLNLINDLTLTVDNGLLSRFLNCCETLSPIDKCEKSALNQQTINSGSNENKFKFNYLLFRILFSISALTTDDTVKQAAKHLYELNKSQLDSIKLACYLKFVEELKSNCESWTDNSLEPIIFGRLIQECGLAKKILDNVVFIFKMSLQPSKDPQLRTRFLLLIPEIFSVDCGSQSHEFFQVCFEDIINNMVLPNIVWKAGRAACAVRMSSVACLLLILQSELIKSIHPKQTTIESIFQLMLTTLDDEDKSTRLYTCKIFNLMLKYYGRTLSKDQLHKFYLEFIKRLDDQSEEIRFEIIKTFTVYINNLSEGGNYDKVLYQSHIEYIYENLLIYLDDPSLDMQLKIFDLLKTASVLDAKKLSEAIERVKSKHRNAEYCNELLKICRAQTE